MRRPYKGVARRQLGLVTTPQLRDLGWTNAAIDAAVARGEIVAVRRGVWAAAGAPVSGEQMWLAAALAVPDSVLGFGTAWDAWQLKTRLDPPEIDLLVAGRRAPVLEGVRGHTTMWLPPRQMARVGALPVTSVARTLVDGCGLVGDRALEGAVKDAVRRKLVSLIAIARCIDDVPVSGRRRIRPLREVLAVRIPGYDPGDSDPEADTVELLVRAGYPRPVQNLRVRVSGETFEIDIAWPDIRKGFEWDSLQFHLDPFAFHRDRRKLLVLKTAGWDVLPLTARSGRGEILAAAAQFFADGP